MRTERKRKKAKKNQENKKKRKKKDEEKKEKRRWEKEGEKEKKVLMDYNYDPQSFLLTSVS